jgi:hypothetical protein
MKYVLSVIMALLVHLLCQCTSAPSSITVRYVHPASGDTLLVRTELLPAEPSTPGPTLRFRESVTIPYSARWLDGLGIVTGKPGTQTTTESFGYHDSLGVVRLVDHPALYSVTDGEGHFTDFAWFWKPLLETPADTLYSFSDRGYSEKPYDEWGGPLIRHRLTVVSPESLASLPDTLRTYEIEEVAYGQGWRERKTYTRDLRLYQYRYFTAIETWRTFTILSEDWERLNAFWKRNHLTTRIHMW